MPPETLVGVCGGNAMSKEFARERLLSAVRACVSLRTLEAKALLEQRQRMRRTPYHRRAADTAEARHLNNPLHMHASTPTPD
jgi:hypothetical protein